MIVAGTRFRIARVPLAQIVVSEHQARYWKRLKHYVKLLSDPTHAGEDAGLVALAPHDFTASASLPLYTLLDGHHRYLAAVMTGRRDLLAIIHYEPGQAGYDDATAV